MAIVSLSAYAGTGVASGGNSSAGIWNSPANATGAPNSSYSVCYPSATSGNMGYLNLTNFGFSVPAGSTITGVTAVITRYYEAVGKSGYTVVDHTVQLLVGGSRAGTNLAATSTNWPTSSGTASYGGTSNTWGNSLTATQVNASTFGISIQILGNQAATTAYYQAYVDSVQLQVSYNVNAGVATGPATITEAVSQSTSVYQNITYFTPSGASAVAETVGSGTAYPLSIVPSAATAIAEAVGSSIPYGYSGSNTNTGFTSTVTTVSHTSPFGNSVGWSNPDYSRVADGNNATTTTTNTGYTSGYNYETDSILLNLGDLGIPSTAVILSGTITCTWSGSSTSGTLGFYFTNSNSSVQHSPTSIISHPKVANTTQTDVLSITTNNMDSTAQAGSFWAPGVGYLAVQGIGTDYLGSGNTQVTFNIDSVTVSVNYVASTPMYQGANGSAVVATTMGSPVIWNSTSTPVLIGMGMSATSTASVAVGKRKMIGTKVLSQSWGAQPHIINRKRATLSGTIAGPTSGVTVKVGHLKTIGTSIPASSNIQVTGSQRTRGINPQVTATSGMSDAVVMQKSLVWTVSSTSDIEMSISNQPASTPVNIGFEIDAVSSIGLTINVVKGIGSTVASASSVNALANRITSLTSSTSATSNVTVSSGRQRDITPNTVAATSGANVSTKRNRGVGFSESAASTVNASSIRNRGLVSPVAVSTNVTLSVNRLLAMSGSVSSSSAVTFTTGRLKNLAIGLTDTSAVNATVSRTRTTGFSETASSGTNFYLSRAKFIGVGTIAATSSDAFDTMRNRGTGFSESATTSLNLAVNRIRATSFSDSVTSATTFTANRIRTTGFTENATGDVSITVGRAVYLGMNPITANSSELFGNSRQRGLNLATGASSQLTLNTGRNRDVSASSSSISGMVSDSTRQRGVGTAVSAASGMNYAFIRQRGVGLGVAGESLIAFDSMRNRSASGTMSGSSNLVFTTGRTKMVMSGMTSTSNVQADSKRNRDVVGNVPVASSVNAAAGRKRDVAVTSNSSSGVNPVLLARLRGVGSALTATSDVEAMVRRMRGLVTTYGSSATVATALNRKRGVSASSHSSSTVLTTVGRIRGTGYSVVVQSGDGVTLDRVLSVTAEIDATSDVNVFLSRAKFLGFQIDALSDIEVNLALKPYYTQFYLNIYQDQVVVSGQTLNKQQVLAFASDVNRLPVMTVNSLPQVFDVQAVGIQQLTVNTTLPESDVGSLE